MDGDVSTDAGQIDDYLSYIYQKLLQPLYRDCGKEANMSTGNPYNSTNSRSSLDSNNSDTFHRSQICFSQNKDQMNSIDFRARNFPDFGAVESPLTSVVRTRRRKTGLTDGERVCIVCGETASGYNFDRLTCESCKAFFRRNALKPSDKVSIVIFLG